jgi:phage replication O-like protein O
MVASPQLEHGHTRLANAILQAMVAFPWTSPVQLRLVLHVVRQSYGFNRKMARSASLAELAVTLREPRSSVHRALQTLVGAGVLVRDESGRLRLVKDYEKWRAAVPPMGQKRPAAVPPVGQDAETPAPSEAVSPMGQPDAAPAVPPMGQAVPQVGQVLSKGIERQLERQNNNNARGPELALGAAGTALDGFSEWYADYPEKKARGAAEKAWRALKPGPEVRALLSAAVTAQKKHRAAAEQRGDFVPRWPYPATWLNQKRWLDDLTVAIPAEPSSGAPKAPAGKYANIGERHETA